MPQVGSRHFSYSPKGKEAAQRYAKRTGKRIIKKNPVKKKRKKS
jgi:hypothetical protein